jgi:hypothetical protein
MNRRRSLLAPIALLASLSFGLSLAASAHIVRAQPTLLALVAGSQRVVFAEIVDPNDVATLEGSSERRPVVRIALREVIKGEGRPGQTLRFASHGHGVAEYGVGEHALIFLAPLATNRELAVLQQAGVNWVSLQDHDSRYVLSEASRERVLAAARGYAAAGREADPVQRSDALHRITLDLLTSGDPRLASSAIRDLVPAEGARLVRRADVPRLLEEVIDSPSVVISVRVGLLVALERQGLLDARPVWERLLRTTAEPDLLQVVRAAGRHPSPKVNLILIEMLKGDAAVAEAAALALAGPLHADAVPALAVALERPEPRVRMASIRALGGIGTPAARRAIEAAAESHTDSATRRRAAAEVRSGARTR